MISNYQRALDLADHIAEVDETPRELVKQLHQYGLLAPDLPDPEIEYKDGACWLDSDTTSVESHYDPASNECIITTGVAYDLTPTEAKQLAYALLAAANHAEEQANE